MHKWNRGRSCAALAFDRLERRVTLSSASSILGDGPGVAPSLASTTTTSSTAGFIGKLPSTPTTTVSTVPSNGDQNPYGVAKVPRGFLVTNFNNASNLQGTGTTIQKVFLNGTSKTWYKAPAGFGLSGAIGVLSQGYVFVGNVPTTDGTAATIKPGSLVVLNRYGQAIANLKNKAMLDGPWGMTVYEQGDTALIFISNVLNGTITRLDVSLGHGLAITSATTIARGYQTQANSAALVLGPAGLSYDPRTGVLYVASTADNAIYAVANAGLRTTAADKGTVVVQNDGKLQGPIGLTFAPNGDLLATNGDAVSANPTTPSLLLEYTTRGAFVNSLSLDSSQGAAFGLVIKRVGNELWLGTVNDATNTLDIRKIKV